jgi:hypothetical protein
VIEIGADELEVTCDRGSIGQTNLVIAIERPPEFLREL